MRYHDVWIVVPAFNEASVIGDVIADVRSVFDHVVCVDDGSRDDTDDVALRAGAHVVRHPVNLGQGAAIQTGVEYARSQPGAAVFATFDADGQHRVKDVVRMIDRLSAEDADLVVGTRFADPGVVSRTPLAEADRVARGGVAEPAQPQAGADRCAQRPAGVQQDGGRRAEHHHQRHGPRQRVHRAGLRKPLAGSRRAGRDSLHRLLEVEGPAPAQRRQHHLRRLAAREDVAMNWIQVLLIVSVLALLVYLLRSRGSARSKAWVKVGYVLFVIVSIYAILRPDDTTVVANWVGVDRGADLITYMLIIAFAFTTLSTYMRFKDIELKYARLARAVALQNARVPEQRG